MTALSLEQRTQLDQAYQDYHKEIAEPPEFTKRIISVRDYGDGIVEVGYCTPSLKSAPTDDQVQERKNERDKMTPDEKEQVRKINLDRSIRRTRANVRRKCMAGGLDHLLTLTYRENITDLASGWKDFARFVRKVRKRYPDWKYCAVHEFQKRGAVHFHVAVKGFQDVRFLRSTWLSVVGQGNIDVKAPRSHGSKKWGLVALAGYLVKYISKGIEMVSVRFSKQRYRVSEGIEIPKKTIILEFPLGYDFISEVFDSLGVSKGFHFKADKDVHGWACSWT